MVSDAAQSSFEKRDIDDISFRMDCNLVCKNINAMNNELFKASFFFGHDTTYFDLTRYK